jgi:hypothetical protein
MRGIDRVAVMAALIKHRTTRIGVEKDEARWLRPTGVNFLNDDYHARHIE